MDGWVRATALGLTVLTGFSGLVYEVAWQKYLATRRHAQVYYFHGAPFSRDALTSIWQRCRDDSEQRCQPARARIEHRIGPLSDARG